MNSKHNENQGESGDANFETRSGPPPIPEILSRPIDSPEGLPFRGKSGESDLANVSTAWGVAMDFVGSFLGAMLLGYFADRWQQTSPRYTLIGLVVGFTFALYRIISRTLADERRENEARSRGKKR